MRRPIGLTVPYREVGYTEKSGWVGLTDEDILRHQDLVPNTYSLDLIEFAKALEKTMKEKNDRNHQRI